MHRDRDVAPVVADPVNVAGRGEAAYVAGVVDAVADGLQSGPAVAQREQFLVLGALDHADHAPRDVIVDRCHLSGPPDQGADRERSVRLGMQDVADVPVRAALALGAGQDVQAGQDRPQLVGHQGGRVPPVGVAARGCADRGHQVKRDIGDGRSAVRHRKPPRAGGTWTG